MFYSPNPACHCGTTANSYTYITAGGVSGGGKCSAVLRHADIKQDMIMCIIR